MPFATGHDVRRLVMDTLRAALRGLEAERLRQLPEPPLPSKENKGQGPSKKKKGQEPSNKEKDQGPPPADIVDEDVLSEPEHEHSTRRVLPSSIRYYTMSYDYAMRKFGTDKPDLRITPDHCSNVSTSQFGISTMGSRIS